MPVFDFNLAVVCDRYTCKRHVWSFDRGRRHGAYDDSGDSKYRGGYKYDSEYRNYIAIYQLWRHVSFIFINRNGACAKCVESDKLKKNERRNDMAQKRRRTDARKKKRRRRRFVKRMLSFLCVLAVLTFVISLVYTVFQVKKINVTGNQYTEKQDVLDWIQRDKLSDNSLYIFCKYNIDRVEQLPSVESVDVKLKSPWIVEVQVHEKELVGRIDYGTEYLYFDANGVASLITSKKLDEIPYIEGVELNSEEVKLGEQIPAEDAEIYQQMNEVSKYLAEHKLNPNRIIYENDGITLYFDKIKILLGKGEFEDKLEQISPILKELESKYSELTGTLHLENYEAGSTTVRFVPDNMPEEGLGESSDEMLDENSEMNDWYGQESGEGSSSQEQYGNESDTTE